MKKRNSETAFKPITPELLSKYDAIAMSETLNMSEEQFVQLINDVCEDYGMQGTRGTNEWGTKTFYFERTYH